jgi:hypothetical protein
MADSTNRRPVIELRRFIRQHSIRVLNVAGRRASNEPEIATFVQEVLELAVNAGLRKTQFLKPRLTLGVFELVGFCFNAIRNNNSANCGQLILANNLRRVYPHGLWMASFT